MGEERDTLEDVVEPYLMREGLIRRTPRGRLLTDEVYRHLGIDAEVRQKNLELF